ncbi:hypothetical protein A2U01_0054016, partial [Trifolium medium]|nr:hypothetical protein [Trifolium medium]
ESRRHGNNKHEARSASGHRYQRSRSATAYGGRHQAAHGGRWRSEVREDSMRRYTSRQRELRMQEHARLEMGGGKQLCVNDELGSGKKLCVNDDVGILGSDPK